MYGVGAVEALARKASIPEHDMPFIVSTFVQNYFDLAQDVADRGIEIYMNVFDESRRKQIIETGGRAVLEWQNGSNSGLTTLRAMLIDAKRTPRVKSATCRDKVVAVLVLSGIVVLLVGVGLLLQSLL